MSVSVVPQPTAWTRAAARSSGTRSRGGRYGDPDIRRRKLRTFSQAMAARQGHLSPPGMPFSTVAEPSKACRPHLTCRDNGPRFQRADLRDRPARVIGAPGPASPRDTLKRFRNSPIAPPLTHDHESRRPSPLPPRRRRQSADPVNGPAEARHQGAWPRHFSNPLCLCPIFAYLPLCVYAAVMSGAPKAACTSCTISAPCRQPS
jgi:hypothetical protein